MLNLTRAVCELHRYDQVDETSAIPMLKDQGFENVAVEFVQVIYDQLAKQSEMHMKTWHEKAKKSSYYNIDTDEDSLIFVWSERYILLFKDEPTDSQFHQIKLFDAYNDKNV
jgi:hypothetical protein